MMTPSQAETELRQRLTCLPIESLPLAQCTGAVLRENIYAERDQPPFDRVTMDGIAIDSAAVGAGHRAFIVQGTQAAGAPRQHLESPRHCLEVMTGAVLPQGCDCVIPIEKLQLNDGRAGLDPAALAGPGLNVHRRGADGHQGERLLQTGMMLQAPEIAVIASAGMARVRVSAQPALMVVSNGDELVEPGEAILSHQIRRSNVYAVTAALRQRGFARMGTDHLPDDADLMRDRLRQHLRTHDVLILSGGVSMGRFDFVPRILGELGVQTVFHKIAQRPGKPMWFGLSPQGVAVFGLPGNPVSTLICLIRYVLPALYGAMGRQAPPAERIALGKEVSFQPALSYFLPATVEYDPWGRAWAQPRPTNGSGDFASLAGTDGFVELPPGPNVWPKGFVTRLYRW